ncbi:hypothetical protein P3W45_000918 [Vairimorpha bombi]|jgi:26S proteasome regulatory subunit N3
MNYSDNKSSEQSGLDKSSYDLIKNIIKRNDYELFNRKYSYIFNRISEFRADCTSIITKTLDLIIMFKQKQYKEVISFVEKDIKELLLGKIRSYDICISKILRMYYLARKELGLPNDLFFNLMIPNKELGNDESVSVITTCLLDYLISNNVYKRITNKIAQSELPRYNFYHGIIELVEGNYDLASSLFNSSTKNSILKRYMIITMLLQSNYNIPLEFDKKIKNYFDLIKIVRDADLESYMIFINEKRTQLIQDKTYFIILRLSQNVIQEKIRCMSLVYSRISYEDMSSRLNINKEDLDYLLKKSINQGLINGRVENNVYYTCKTPKNIKNNKFEFRELMNVNKMIKEEMKYPKIEPLCYEKANK